MESEIPEENTSRENVRRSTRIKRQPTSMPIAQTNSKINQKLPTTIADETDLKKIRKYYLDKTVRRSTSSLETIFEEPADDQKWKSSRKSLRTLNFHRTASEMKAKIKKRQLKSKKFFLKKRKWSKVTVDLLMKTLSILEQDNDNLNKITA